MAIYADHPFKLITSPAFLKAQGAETDVFDDLASDMALVHNLIARYLNSIYLQAPHIPAADERDFIRYMRGWYDLVHVHHTNEETDFFPALEEMTGEKGIMEANVEQHHAFEPGLVAFKKYLDELQAGREKFDGAKVVELIDSFGEVLVQHLTDEIQTLLGLRRFGVEKMKGVMEKMNQEAEKGMVGFPLFPPSLPVSLQSTERMLTLGQKELGFVSLVSAWAQLDTEYEGGRWKSWPPAPAPMKFLLTTLLWKWNGNLVKFGACDRHGRLRPLYAVAQETKEKK